MATETMPPVIWQFNPYAIPLFLSAIPLAVIIYIAWQRRSNLAVKMFIGIITGALGLVLAYALELLSANLTGMMLWLRFEYLFHSAIVFYPLFALAYSGYEAAITPGRVLALFIVPAIIFVLISTNDSHGLIYSHTSAREVESLVLFEREYGIGFWVWIAYLSANFIAGYGVLFAKAVRSPRYFREQIAWLGLALFLPAVGIVFTQLKLTPFPLLDLTPYMIAIACIPLAISLFRFNLFNLVPAAYEQVIESIDDAVIVCDVNHRIAQANSAAARLTGRTTAQNLGCTVERVLLETANLRLEQHVFENCGAHEVVTNHQNSSERYYDLHISPLRNRRGLVTGQVFVLRDITDRRHAERQSLDLAIERERVRLLKSFIRDVSHDVRTPISVILTSVYLLDKMGTNASQLLEAFSEAGTMPEPQALEAGLTEVTSLMSRMKEKAYGIQDSALRLERLIESMLEVIQLESAFQFDFEMHDLNALALDCVEAYRAAAHQKQLRLEFAPDDHLPLLYADAEQLSHAINHLVENAVQYTALGSIRVCTYQADEEAIIEIDDTGVGVSDDDLPHIFEPFYRTDKARSTSSGGGGLGLFIARRIIEAHGGRIEAKSVPGKGSTFRICMPLIRKPPPSPVLMSSLPN